MFKRLNGLNGAGLLVKSKAERAEQSDVTVATRQYFGKKDQPVGIVICSAVPQTRYPKSAGSYPVQHTHHSKGDDKIVVLTACRECQHDVSKVARACPQCGSPFPGRPIWNGTGVDWKTQATLLGYPLIHIAYGRDARGKLRVAKGVIAIGQFAIGLIAIAQFGIGILFGFGQFFLAFTAIAQLAITPAIGIGQFATGYAALGQITFGYYAMGQFAYGLHAWGVNQQHTDALVFFSHYLPFFRPSQ